MVYKSINDSLFTSSYCQRVLESAMNFNKLMHDRECIVLVLCFCIRGCWSLCVSSSEQCGCSSVRPNILESKIVGGSTARNHSWPWMVSLRRLLANHTSTSPGSNFCGGTLISNRFVLTAAHCLDSFVRANLSKLFVAVGVNFRNETNPVRFRIKSFIIHSQYQRKTYKNDIALIELARSVDFMDSSIGFICLPPNDTLAYPYENMTGVAIGFGAIKQGGPSSYTLQQVRLPVVPITNKYCADTINDNITQFCAGYNEGGKDTCQGDSGGPFMVYDENSDTWNLAGITSYGIGCAEAKRPGIYTRVSLYVNWIQENINNSQPNSVPQTGSVSRFIRLFLFYMNLIFLN